MAALSLVPSVRPAHPFQGRQRQGAQVAQLQLDRARPAQGFQRVQQGGEGQGGRQASAPGGVEVDEAGKVGPLLAPPPGRQAAEAGGQGGVQLGQAVRGFQVVQGDLAGPLGGGRAVKEGGGVG